VQANKRPSHFPRLAAHWHLEAVDRIQAPELYPFISHFWNESNKRILLGHILDKCIALECRRELLIS
jgi:hypothetical protein